ncbi:MAG: divergent polysaccharide deacetylase family protein [Pseudomonadota bacterium]
MAVRSEVPGKGGLIALVSAWLVTLAAVCGLAAYAFLGGAVSDHGSEAKRSAESDQSASPRVTNNPDDQTVNQQASAPGGQQQDDLGSLQQMSDRQPDLQEDPLVGTVGDGSQFAASGSAIGGSATDAAQTGGPETGRPAPLVEGSGPAWQRFARPFDPADSRPRIAIVITGLGLSDQFTEAAIDLLPPEITLSFSPYAIGLDKWISRARDRGHEVMIDLPLEPLTYPDDDPGSLTLLTALPTGENLSRLETILGKGDKLVGLAGYMGSRFSATREKMRPILDSLKDKGLLYLDNHPVDKAHAAKLASELGVPRAINNRLLDDEPTSARTIDSRLAYTERIALQDGFAVAMAQPYPITIKQLLAWAQGLADRGLALAPLTAVADSQPLR